MKKTLLAASLFTVLVLGSCRTAPPVVTEKLTAAEFFQKAQDASEAGDYRLALAYYDAFRASYPGDRDRNLWADYETAFLWYKLENYDTALRMIDGLLDLYAKDKELPAGPKVLAEKVKVKITEAIARNALSTPAPKK
jgi:outer membrane protein assembly factor BamD (BamD/ComL family)